MAKKKVSKKRKWSPINITGEPITDRIIEKIAKKICFINPSDIMINVKYKGCGNGFVVIDKATGTVVDMAYTKNGRRIKVQNICMSGEAGTILSNTKTKLKVRANFSCPNACLF